MKTTIFLAFMVGIALLSGGVVSLGKTGSSPAVFIGLALMMYAMIMTIRAKRVAQKKR